MKSLERFVAAILLPSLPALIMLNELPIVDFEDLAVYV